MTVAIFPICTSTQEEYDFSIPFLPFLYLPRRALPCQFRSFGSHNQEWKIDFKKYTIREACATVIGMQQSSEKPNTQVENSFPLKKKIHTKLDNQNQKFKGYFLQGVAQHHYNLDINIIYIHWLVWSGAIMVGINERLGRFYLIRQGLGSHRGLLNKGLLWLVFLGRIF